MQNKKVHEKINVAVRISRTLNEAIQKQAAAERRSFSDMLRLLVEDGLRAKEKNEE